MQTKTSIYLLVLFFIQYTFSPAYAQDSVSIKGYLAGVDSVVLKITGDQEKNMIIRNGEYFTFNVLKNANVIITPQKDNIEFTPKSYTIEDASYDVENLDFDAPWHILTDDEVEFYSETSTTLKKVILPKGHFTNIYIPDSLSGQVIEKIQDPGSGVFKKMGITKIRLPKKLISLGRNAFVDNKIRYIEFPESLKEIQKNAFKNNDISVIEWNNKLESIGNNAFDNNLFTELVLPISLKTIGDYSFSNNQLQKVILNDSLISIGFGAFSENNLKEISISSQVRLIGRYAFAGNEITEIKLPIYDIHLHSHIGWSLDDLNNITFIDKDNLTVDYNPFIEYSSEYTFWGTYVQGEVNGVGDFELEVSGDTSFSIRGNRSYKIELSKGMDVSIQVLNKEGITFLPAQYNYENVQDSLLNQNFITEPYTLRDEDVTLVGNGYIDHCFYSFENKNIIIPDSLQGQLIRGFYDRYDYDQRGLDSKSIQYLKLPNSVEYFGYNSLRVNSIKNLKLPENTKIIKGEAFNHILIDTLILPKNVKSIGYEAFAQAKIKYLQLNEGLEVIEEKAFSYSNELILDTLILPSSILSVSASAFANYLEERLAILPEVNKKNFSFNHWNRIHPKQDEVVRFEAGSVVNLADKEGYTYVADLTLNGVEVLITAPEFTHVTVTGDTDDEIIIQKNNEKTNYPIYVETGGSITITGELYGKKFKPIELVNLTSNQNVELIIDDEVISLIDDGLLSQVIAYPNPNKGSFMISNLPKEEVNIKIFNSIGKKVKEYANVAPFTNYYISGEKGLYFILIETLNSERIIKLIRE